MPGLTANLAAKLRPDRDELYRLVAAETDPAHAAGFEQLTPGPLAAALIVAGIGLYALVWAPLRLLRRS